MLAKEVSVTGMLTAQDCWEAIESIENDYRNYQGGITRWNSGYDCHLKAGAKKKVEALHRRSWKLSPDEEE